MTTILVADDEKHIRELVELTLKHNNYHVLTAADGESALEIATRERPALALLDIRMPKMDGYEVCRQIKRDPAIATMPVVFISAKAQEDEIQMGYAAGAQDYLLKPFDMEDLLVSVKRLLA
jgi:two-component system alkaline phosphatase synthesis response regulator PhoP